MPPARVNLLVMAYFSQGVQEEHLNNLHDAYRAYALASNLSARVFGRSSHLAVRFNKSFHDCYQMFSIAKIETSSRDPSLRAA
eukprot:464942-Pelagomonas_calceolata.AAC.2